MFVRIRFKVVITFFGGIIMKTGISKKLLSVLLAVLTVITMAAPGFPLLPPRSIRAAALSACTILRSFMRTVPLCPPIRRTVRPLI